MILNNIIFIILFLINICYAQYKYDITINLSESGWSKQSGKLKTTMLGDNGKYNETIILSNSEENIDPKFPKKDYTIFLNNTIENINRIELKWTTQSMYITAPKISVSKIDLYPSYLENNKYKISFCASNENQELVAKKFVPFWIKC